MQFYWQPSAIFRAISGLGCTKVHVIGLFVWPFSHCKNCTVAMKCTRASSETKKRSVTYSTYKKWKDFDREYRSISWLNCDVQMQSGTKTVTALKCAVCARFKERLKTDRNFNDSWIVGAKSVKTSNIRDHAQSNQHKHSMALLQKQQAAVEGKDLTSCAPIAMALTSLADDDKERLHRKFDVAIWSLNTYNLLKIIIIWVYMKFISIQ